MRVTLELDIEERSRRERVEHLGERRDPRRRRAPPTSERVDPLGSPLDATQRLVVEEHGHAVAAQADVELDAVAGRDAGSPRPAPRASSPARPASHPGARAGAASRSPWPSAEPQPRGDPEVVRGVQGRVADRRPVGEQPRLLDARRSPAPRCSRGTRVAVRVHRRRLEPGRPGDRRVGAVRDARRRTGTRRRTSAGSRPRPAWR